MHTGRPTPEAYAQAAGSLYFGVPTVWSRIAGSPAEAAALSRARLLVSGSAALPAPVFRDLEALTGLRPVERYGMTETLITVSGRAGGEVRPGTVGTPVRGIRTRIAAEPGAEIGELQLTGPTLFSGYLGRPEATAAAYTEDGWFRTGDIAAVDETDGVHRIVGRASIDLIKSGGYRIGAGEIENALLDHPGSARRPSSDCRTPTSANGSWPSSSRRASPARNSPTSSPRTCRCTNAPARSAS